MLFMRFVPRALTIPLTTSLRSYSAMASSAIPPQHFTLDRTLFNETLYTQVRNVWFANLPENFTRTTDASMKRWWGIGASDQEKAAFDTECRLHFIAAIESIGPDKISLPPFNGYEREEKENIHLIAKPFLDEINSLEGDDNTQKRADTYLALILLLDQITRNTLRSPPGLVRLYTHYDRLAWSLLKTAPTLSPNPINHESYTGRPVIKLWFGLPLMHAEHIASHEMGNAFREELRLEAEPAGTAEDVVAAMGPAKAHWDIIKRFGRYPHRNQCLGRESTQEEMEWLKTGDTFGVPQDQEKQEDGKDEL